MKFTNLVVNGCSYTDDRFATTWATLLAQKFSQVNYTNLASAAAGNDYICRSTMHFLSEQQPDPATTLVVIMWSGTGRKDISVPGDWWYHIKETYACGRNHNDKQYYVFSGGLNNSWTRNTLTKKIFSWPYKLCDPTTLCEDNLLNFVNLENFLKVKGYTYMFGSYVNYWHTQEQSNFSAGDYCIGYFCQDHSLYQQLDFSKWFFVNQDKDCLAEFARDIDQLDDTGHPTQIGHQKFCDQVVWPAVQSVC